MTDLESLLTPPTIALDEEGRQIYSDLRQAEDSTQQRLLEIGAHLYLSTNGLVRTHTTEGPRQRLLVVPEACLTQVHAEWPALIKKLRPFLQEFLHYLASRRDNRTAGVGARSTALPVWVGHDLSCDQVRLARQLRYNTAEAFRAGTLTAAEVRLLIENKTDQLRQHAANATASRKHGRAEELRERLKTVEKELRDFKELARSGVPLKARLTSGEGLKLRAWWSGAEKGVEGFGLATFALVAALNGVEPTHAPARQRTSKLGEPLLELPESRLKLYAIPK